MEVSCSLRGPADLPPGRVPGTYLARGWMKLIISLRIKCKKMEKLIG